MKKMKAVGFCGASQLTDSTLIKIKMVAMKN